MSHVSREIHTRQCYCTFFTLSFWTPFRCTGGFIGFIVTFRYYPNFAAL